MTRPLRIAFLTTFYPPYSFGGDAVDVERLARALVRRGHHVTVVHDVDAHTALAPRMAEMPAYDHGTIDVVSLRSGLGGLGPLLVQQIGRPVVHHWRLARLFRERAFDLVTFNNISLIGGPGLLAYGRGALRVYLAQEHWLVCASHVLWRHNREACTGRQCVRCVLAYRRPPQLWRYTGMLERHLRHVDLFIARSRFSRDKHREFGFPREMAVLPYFLPEEAAQAPGTDRVPPHVRPYFLFVGRLERIKGLDTIIPVFAQYQEADLLVVGAGTEEAALRSLAAGNPRVRFVGHVPNDQLGRYYRHAIATIVPSAGFETFGIVLIEAFRSGSPVIARGIGPFPEIIEESGGGELFGDDQQLLSSMQRLQQNPAYRERLAASAYGASLERWAESVVVDRFLELVNRAAREKAARERTAMPAWVA